MRQLPRQDQYRNLRIAVQAVRLESAGDGGSIALAPLATDTIPRTTPIRPYPRMAAPPESLCVGASVAGE